MRRVEDDEIAQNKAVLGEAVLNLVPDTLRQTMTSDPKFLGIFGLVMTTDGTVNFKGGPSFITSKLYNTIRNVDETGLAEKISDKSGQEWSVQMIEDEERRRCPTLVQGDKSVRFFEGLLLLSDAKTRIFGLNELVRDAGLPTKDVEKWSGIVADNALTDAQMISFHEDLEDSPFRFSDRLSAALKTGKTTTDQFVPASRRYFERLVGSWSDAPTMKDHARRGAKENAARLIKWDPKYGLLIALTTSSHTELSSVIPLEEVKKDTVLEVLQLLLDRGDPISRLGIVQAVIPLLGKFPEFSELIEKHVERIILDDPTLENSEMHILSWLFVFVDTEISFNGVLRGKPVFYRRLASLAQASLIQRQMLLERADPTPLCKWIRAHRAGQYYTQTLVDMRTAPRWNPDLIHPEQLKQEFLGRLLGSGATHGEQLRQSRLYDLMSLHSEAQDGLKSVIDYPRPYFPGPLEGAMPPSEALPDDLLSIIETQLTEKELSTRSFIAAINLANVFLVDTKLTSKISGLLKSGRYHLRHANDIEELAAVLVGLARIAAVARDEELAGDVRVLVRRYRDDLHQKISLPQAYRTLFFAAAAFEDLRDWCGYVGEVLEDLAFGPLSEEEASELQALIVHLCAAEPDLWTVTGSASAALAGFLSS